MLQRTMDGFNLQHNINLTTGRKHYVQSNRLKRISLLTCIFIASFLLHIAMKRKIATSTSSMTPIKKQKEYIRIFYNLFGNATDTRFKSLAIFNEQFLGIDPDLHDVNITVTSIGVRSEYIRDHFRGKYLEEGDEGETLHSLWKYCRRKKHAKVVYLHSKGSFHPSKSNDRLRRFLTEGALSKECAELPNECNVCSSRMSAHRKYDISSYHGC